MKKSLPFFAVPKRRICYFVLFVVFWFIIVGSTILMLYAMRSIPPSLADEFLRGAVISTAFILLGEVLVLAVIFLVREKNKKQPLLLLTIIFVICSFLFLFILTTSQASLDNFQADTKVRSGLVRIRLIEQLFFENNQRYTDSITELETIATSVPRYPRFHPQDGQTYPIELSKDEQNFWVSGFLSQIEKYFICDKAKCYIEYKK